MPDSIRSHGSPEISMHGLRPQPSLPVGASQTWYDVTSVPRVERPHLDYVAEADACIVGGGLSGLTLARELAKRGWAVVVLEADRIGRASCRERV